MSIESDNDSSVTIYAELNFPDHKNCHNSLQSVCPSFDQNRSPRSNLKCARAQCQVLESTILLNERRNVKLQCDGRVSAATAEICRGGGTKKSDFRSGGGDFESQIDSLYLSHYKFGSAPLYDNVESLREKFQRFPTPEVQWDKNRDFHRNIEPIYESISELNNSESADKSGALFSGGRLEVLDRLQRDLPPPGRISESSYCHQNRTQLDYTPSIRSKGFTANQNRQRRKPRRCTSGATFRPCKMREHLSKPGTDAMSGTNQTGARHHVHSSQRLNSAPGGGAEAARLSFTSTSTGYSSARSSVRSSGENCDDFPPPDPASPPIAGTEPTLSTDTLNATPTATTSRRCNVDVNCHVDVSGPVPKSLTHVHSAPAIASARKRQNGLTYEERIAVELLDTERDYVLDLRAVIKHYLDPLLSERETTGIPANEICSVFANIEQVYEFSARLYECMDACRLDLDQIASCFVHKKAGFECYAEYCTQYAKSTVSLQKLTQKDTAKSVLDQCQVAAGHSLPLHAYLLKPIQRLLKYSLFFENALNQRQCQADQKKTSPNTTPVKKSSLKSSTSQKSENLAPAGAIFRRQNHGAGATMLEHALVCMNEWAGAINDIKRKQEHAQRRDTIQTLLQGWRSAQSNDLSQYGDLLLEGKFLLAGTKTARLLFLFEEMLLIAKEKADGTLVCKDYIMCSALMLVENASNNDPLTFQVIAYDNPKVHYTLQSRSVDQKRQWCYELKRALLDHCGAHIEPAVKKQLLASDFMGDCSKLAACQARGVPTCSGPERTPIHVLDLDRANASTPGKGNKVANPSKRSKFDFNFSGTRRYQSSTPKYLAQRQKAQKRRKSTDGLDLRLSVREFEKKEAGNELGPVECLKTSPGKSDVLLVDSKCARSRSSSDLYNACALSESGPMPIEQPVPVVYRRKEHSAPPVDPEQRPKSTHIDSANEIGKKSSQDKTPTISERNKSFQLLRFRRSREPKQTPFELTPKICSEYSEGDTGLGSECLHSAGSSNCESSQQSNMRASQHKLRMPAHSTPRYPVGANGANGVRKQRRRIDMSLAGNVQREDDFGGGEMAPCVECAACDCARANPAAGANLGNITVLEVNSDSCCCCQSQSTQNHSKLPAPIPPESQSRPFGDNHQQIYLVAPVIIEGDCDQVPISEPVKCHVKCEMSCKVSQVMLWDCPQECIDCDMMECNDCQTDNRCCPCVIEENNESGFDDGSVLTENRPTGGLTPNFTDYKRESQPNLVRHTSSRQSNANVNLAHCQKTQCGDNFAGMLPTETKMDVRDINLVGNEGESSVAALERSFARLLAELNAVAGEDFDGETRAAPAPVASNSSLPSAAPLHESAAKSRSLESLSENALGAASLHVVQGASARERRSRESVYDALFDWELERRLDQIRNAAANAAPRINVSGVNMSLTETQEQPPPVPKHASSSHLTSVAGSTSVYRCGRLVSCGGDARQGAENGVFDPLRRLVDIENSVSQWEDRHRQDFTSTKSTHWHSANRLQQQQNQPQPNSQSPSHFAGAAILSVPGMPQVPQPLSSSALHGSNGTGPMVNLGIVRHMVQQWQMSDGVDCVKL